ncbi:hypothetical protein [Trinickia fusca]|uniref:DUF4034 domain-containing protein n=1 Tax=Trinickia fusca TaxID=2419777 RepID=A0A494XPA7_9BURK|nr:hypothetical protein [Trinickia fusca]RKP49363.1 hypothetical protein D7S89_11405 [Trinickia fusca]
MPPRNLIAAACLAACVAAAPARAQLVHTAYPDEAPTNTYRSYAHGNLGVLSEHYGRLTLITAYRVLTGKPLTDRDLGYLVAAPDTWEYDNDDRDHWEKARDAVLGEQKPWDVDDYNNPANPCHGDAFRTATSQLESLKKQYGVTDDVRDWAHAQTVVFANCTKAGKGSMPVALSSEAPQWLKDARTYQLAAATYYAGKREDASAMFAAIAAQPESPWHAMAAYTVDRIAFDEALAKTSAERVDALTQLAQTVSAQEAAASGVDKARLHSLARHIAFEQEPEDELRRIENAIATEAWTPDTVQDLKDYLFAANHEDEGSVDWRRHLVQIAGKSSMTAWITAVQSAWDSKTASAAFADSLYQWHVTQSNVWLVPTLMNASSPLELPADVATAAAAVPDNDPAFATLQYQLLRLRDVGIRAARAAGKDTRPLELAIAADAQKLLDKEARHFPERSLNLIHRIRATYARDPKTYVANAWMEAAEESPLKPGSDKQARTAGFADEFAKQMNLRMPVDKLVALWRVGAGGSDPSHLALTNMLWMRAALLHRNDVTLLLADDFKRFNPAIADDVDAYVKASGPDDQLFRLTAIALEQPSLSALLADSGWVSSELAPSTGDTKLGSSNHEQPAPVLFQSKADEQQAARELAELSGMSGGVAYFGNALVAHVKHHPFSLRNAHLLASLVEDSRGADETKISRAAFRLLHHWYFFTPAAHATKYYY